jgi:molybdopterin converting factor small subunit
MRVTVEFFGVARHFAEVADCELELDEGARLGDVVRELAQRFPRLVGDRVIGQGEELSQSFALSINGGMVTQNLDVRIADNDRLLLISATWGG